MPCAPLFDYFLLFWQSLSSKQSCVFLDRSPDALFDEVTVLFSLEQIAFNFNELYNNNKKTATFFCSFHMLLQFQCKKCLKNIATYITIFEKSCHEIRHFRAAIILEGLIFTCLMFTVLAIHCAKSIFLMIALFTRMTNLFPTAKCLSHVV